MSIWNTALLRQRTEAASKLPKGNMPEVGTVVFNSEYKVVSRNEADGWFLATNGIGCVSRNSGKWRYATHAEIDQFERDSALPDIVDPIEAEARRIANDWNTKSPSWQTSDFAHHCINRGIEIERARKAGE